MTEAVYSLITVSAVCALISLVTTTDACFGAVRFICSLLVFVTLLTSLSPILSAIGELTLGIDNSKTDISSPETDDAIIEESGRYICSYTKDMICERFGIAEDAISVSVSLDTADIESVRIKLISVTAYTELPVPYEMITKLVNEQLMCECIVLKNDNEGDESYVKEDD